MECREVTLYPSYVSLPPRALRCLALQKSLELSLSTLVSYPAKGSQSQAKKNDHQDCFPLPGIP